MSYELRFKEEALNEWRRLDAIIREQFKRKLAEGEAAGHDIVSAINKISAHSL